MRTDHPGTWARMTLYADMNNNGRYDASSDTQLLRTVGVQQIIGAMFVQRICYREPIASALCWKELMDQWFNRQPGC